MASQVFKLCLLMLALVGLFSSGVTAQSSSSGITSCTSTAMSLSPCLSNNTRSSTRSPSSACCSALANAVQANPQCLCSVLNNGAGSAIGMILPLTLPRACNIQTTALIQCSGAPSPSTLPKAITPSATPLADSPTGSPNDVEPEAPSSDSPTDSGSKTLPEFPGSFSDASITKYSCHLLVFALFIVSWTSAAAPF